MPITSKPHGPFSVRLLKGDRNVRWRKKGHILEREMIMEVGGDAQYHLTEELWLESAAP